MAYDRVAKNCQEQSKVKKMCIMICDDKKISFI
jgi:hypothetical protein